MLYEEDNRKWVKLRIINEKSVKLYLRKKNGLSSNIFALFGMHFFPSSFYVKYIRINTWICFYLYAIRYCHLFFCSYFALKDPNFQRCFIISVKRERALSSGCAYNFLIHTLTDIPFTLFKRTFRIHCWKL